MSHPAARERTFGTNAAAPPAGPPREGCGYGPRWMPAHDSAASVETMHSPTSRLLGTALSIAAASVVLTVALSGCSAATTSALAQPAGAPGSASAGTALTDDD